MKAMIVRRQFAADVTEAAIFTFTDEEYAKVMAMTQDELHTYLSDYNPETQTFNVTDISVTGNITYDMRDTPW